MVVLGIALWVSTRAILREHTVRKGAALLGILTLAAAMRIFRLGGPSFWLDELGTWWVLNSRTVGELSDRLFSVVPNGGSYYWLLWCVVQRFGGSEWVLRAPSALFGLLSIALLARLAARWTPERPRVPYLAALLLSVTYLHVVLSQDARPYALVYLVAVCATYYALSLYQAGFDDRWTGLGFAITSAALIREQWLTLLYVAALGLVLLGRAVSLRRVQRLWFIVACTAALLVPALAKFRQDFGRMPELDWTATMSPMRRVITAFEAVGDPIPLVLLVLSLLLVRRRGVLVAPLLGVIVGMIALGLAVWLVLGKMFFVARYFFPLSIPALLAAACLLDRLADDRPRLAQALVALVVGCSLVLLHGSSLLEQGTFKNYKRNHLWREAIAALDSEHQPADWLFVRTGFIESDATADPARCGPLVREFALSPIIGPYNEQPYDRLLLLTSAWDPIRFASHQARIDAAIDAALADQSRVVLFGLDADVAGQTYFDAFVERVRQRVPELRVERSTAHGDVHRWILSAPITRAL